MRRHLGKMLVAGLCMIIGAASTGTQAWLIKPALDEVMVEGNAYLMWVLPLAFLGVILLKGATTYTQNILLQKTSLKIVETIQNHMFERLIVADLAFIDRRATGTLVSRFLSDVQQMRRALSTVAISLVSDSLTTLALVAVMFDTNWRMAVAAFIIFPVSILFIVKVGRRLRGLFRTTQVETGELTGFLDDAFKGIRQVKAYGMERYESRRAKSQFDLLYRLRYKAAKIQARSVPVLEVLGGVVFAGILGYGGYQVQQQQATVGSFMAFFAAMLMAYQPMRRILGTNVALQRGLAAVERIYEIIDHETRITNRSGAAPLRLASGAVKFASASFSYGNDIPALHAITLDAPAGKLTALVGPSGGGKTTILNLIPRFYDLDEGAVTIDGQDVRDVTLESLRDAVALVSQETGLFNDTVRGNIIYGCPESSEKEVVAAAKAAVADSFIRKLPDGYDTEIGERGVILSGGQRQRLSIARAMLKNAPILLLDEATSALDTESEREVQAALRRLMKGRTTIVIAHRLSTVVDADIIHVIDQGHVLESGSHAELSEAGGLYARLSRLQFANEGAEPGKPTV